ncbi:hypothetical protein GCM10007304_17510 [Rhodococcoides trifolii]|uniref:Glycine-rich domain-containing protein n=1 Tax=Rhodococcoides trifolii TaxID=908250 RepID=A0A917FTL3_9NOCA|nr:hypothetical protein [Rhodococcus trifolii]GGG03869.1 hypothetical protein GCM10007304_17510 [Rhodococcus trifolii]
MTSPDKPTPARSRNFNNLHTLQDYDQSSAASAANQDMFGLAEGARGNLLSNILGGFVNGIGGFIAQFFAGVFGLTGGFLDLVGGFIGVRNDAEDAVAQAGAVTADITELTNRVEALEGGTTTIRTYAFNSTWSRPPNLIELGVAVEGGGHSGRTGSTTRTGYGGDGGLSGGYRFQWFKGDTLTVVGATEDVVIGAGGATPSQAGGQSRFGNHIVSIPGIGAVLSIEGSTVSNSAAERGGSGGNGADGNTGIQLTGGQPGGSSAFGQGGTGGTTSGGTGGNGVNATISPLTRGNGGSGGGGGGTGVFGINGGRGGNGAYPSGGGGGGGGRSAFGTSDGPGGIASDGRVTIIEITSGAA